MYITRGQLESRVKGQSSIVYKDKINTRKRTEEVPSDEKALIGALAQIDGPTAAAKEFNVSPAQASHYSRGIVSQAVGIDKDLKEQVNETSAPIKQSIENKLESIKESALDSLANALDELKEATISKATDASKVAVDMSKILSNFNPKSDNKSPQVAVIIHRPQMKSEESYEHVTVVSKA